LNFFNGLFSRRRPFSVQLSIAPAFLAFLSAMNSPDVLSCFVQAEAPPIVVLRHQRPGLAGIWTEAELKNMKMLVKQNTPTRLIAMKLERTVTSVYSKATREGISLAPTNRSPRD
jgi:hypothetical protein